MLQGIGLFKQIDGNNLSRGILLEELGAFAFEERKKSPKFKVGATMAIFHGKLMPGGGKGFCGVPGNIKRG